MLEGDIGGEMTKNWPKSGFRSIGYFIAGFHQLANSKRPIVKPDDLKGLKIRAIQSKSSILMIEVARSHRRSDGVSGGLYRHPAGHRRWLCKLANDALTAKYYEVAPYISITNHLVGMLNLVMSESVDQKLSAADRKIVDEAGLEAARFQRNLYKEGDQKFLALLKEKAKVNTDVDVAAFQRGSRLTCRNSSSS